MISSFAGSALGVEIGSGAAFGIFAGFAGVGAIANFAQTKHKPKKKKKGKKKIVAKEARGTGTYLTSQEILDLLSKWNNAREAGADDATEFCQIYKESSFNVLAQAGSHRGLMQVGPTAAKTGGLGNGSASAPRNPDYYGHIWEPETNISVGTSYLAYDIRLKGSLEQGLDSYGTGKGYSDSILKCAEKVRAGDVLGGLNEIHK